MKKKRITKIAGCLGIVAGIWMIFLLFYLGTVENMEIFQPRNNTGCHQIEDYTYKVRKDKNTPIGIKKEYSWILEDIPQEDICLAFYVVHQYARVSIDRKVVYSLMPAGENTLCKTVGCNWVMVPLYPEDAGKEILVETIPVYENCKDRTVELLTGSQLQIYFNRLTMDLPQLILGILAILVGIIFVGFALQNYIRHKTGSSLALLGIFSMMMGLWKIMDTRATPLLIPDKPILVFYLSVSMLMLGIVPLMRVMADRFTKKLSLFLDRCSVIIEIVCLVQLGLQTFRVVDFRASLIVTHLVLGISVCVVVGSFLVEKIRYKRNIQGNTVGKAVIICATGVAADLIAYYIKGNSSGLIFTLAAFLIYIIFMGITIIRDYKEQEKKIKEQEEELASTRIAILLSQIQPHFIFNSLSAIETLCKKDADEAAEALDHLSEYLKGSMAGLTEKKKILFEHELQHVKNYLYIEQKRFGNRLEVVYDIQEKDFLIPALTVQPMVENAVRHGICQKLEGGCLTIRTYADAMNWIVEVEDNGVGFQVEDLERMGENHVGVSNVRSRLKMMCDGELEINSVQGEGTKVRMIIPK